MPTITYIVNKVSPAVKEGGNEYIFFAMFDKAVPIA
jgi:hypothetical protein